MGKMTFYSNYLNQVAQSPNQNWRQTQQAIVDEVFDNSTIPYYDIFEEGYPFDFKFVNNPPCWVSTVLDVTTGITKDSDDYRSLYFKDTNHEAGRGRYLKWHDNYWIVYETTTPELESISTCNIRRCNNWLRWITDKGELVEYPCVIENELTSGNAQVAKAITQANSHINVIIQGNSDTLSIGKDTRVIFSGQPFKFYSVNNYAQVDFTNDDAPLLFIDFYLDMIIDEDNLKENIANDTRKEYHVEYDIKQITNSKGEVGKLEPKVYHNNQLINDVKIEFISTNTDVVTVDERGNYELINDGVAVIITQIKGNPASAVSIPISVMDSIIPMYSIVVNPNISYIKQGRSVTLTGKVIDNMNNVVDTNIELSISGDTKYYNVIDNENNTWILTNKLMCNDPIILTFTNSEYNLTYSTQVELKAMF